MAFVRLPTGGLWGVIGLTAAATLVSSGAAAAEPARQAPSEVDLTAPAPEPPAIEEESSWLEAPAERRCGFTVGLGVGANLGSVSGFPNDAVKIGRTEFETDAGFSGGGSGVIWVGLAPTDWLVFGAAFNYGRLKASEHDTGFGAFGLHLDAFPLFGLGGPWREIGIQFQAGVGISTTTEGDIEDAVIDSSIASRLSAGVFYEGIRAWKLSMGPFAAYDGLWSPSAFQPTGWIGWRTALYAGP